MSSRVGAKSPSPRPQVQVAADLHLQVGDVSAHVTGDGTHLRVVSDDLPGLGAALFAASHAATASSRRATLTNLGDILDDVGVAIELVGPRGTVATVGNGQLSPFLSRMTRVRHLRLGSVRVVIPTLFHALNRRTKRPVR